jgi:hypothetical protein
MSHVVRLELVIDSLDSLELACKRLGCSLIKNQKTYKWWNTHVGDYPLPEGMKKEDMGKCAHAIKVPNANWEIGVIEQSDKKFKLIYDFYGPEGQKIHNVCGEKLGKLKQIYTVEHLKKKIKDKKRVKEEMVGKKIRLTIEV